MKTRDSSLTSNIIAYENGELGWSEVVDFFQELVDTGTIFHLQGQYQRTAQAMIESGEISV